MTGLPSLPWIFAAAFLIGFGWWGSIYIVNLLLKAPALWRGRLYPLVRARWFCRRARHRVVEKYSAGDSPDWIKRTRTCRDCLKQLSSVEVHRSELPPPPSSPPVMTLSDLFGLAKRNDEPWRG
jgi:hypothetical protein